MRAGRTGRGRTISEKILSSRGGRDARAGDMVTCQVDLALGTDGSTPMALDYFHAMGGQQVKHPNRLRFFRDHYSPPATLERSAHHHRMVEFGRSHDIRVHGVGDGISHQVVMEEGLVLPGHLVVGADSHTVMCGAMNAFATGIGSSDLAALMITGQIWLRVPGTILVTLHGSLPAGVEAKDVALTLLDRLGEQGVNYRTLEFGGSGVDSMDMESRMVLSNMSVEMGAKAGIFPADGTLEDFLWGRSSREWSAVAADDDAEYEQEVEIDLSKVVPLISVPHSPGKVVEIGEVEGTPVDIVFVGTCTGGRASDIRRTLEVLERAGGLGAGVQLVVTPASRGVQLALLQDGTLQRLVEQGAVITTPGCGPCCCTSGPIPGPGATVLAAQNRNFKARMGSPEARIFLGSASACGAAAALGQIADPRRLLG